MKEIANQHTLLPENLEEFQYLRDLAIQGLLGFVPCGEQWINAYRNYCNNLYGHRLVKLIEAFKQKGISNVRDELEAVFRKTPDNTIAKSTVIRQILAFQDNSNDQYLVNLIENWQKNKIEDWYHVRILISLLSDLDSNTIVFIKDHITDTTIYSNSMNSDYVIHELYRLGLINHRLDGGYDFNQVARDLDRFALTGERNYKKSVMDSLDAGDYDAPSTE